MSISKTTWHMGYLWPHIVHPLMQSVYKLYKEMQWKKEMPLMQSGWMIINPEIDATTLDDHVLSKKKDVRDCSHDEAKSMPDSSSADCPIEYRSK